jgi:hypothetical protein
MIMIIQMMQPMEINGGEGEWSYNKINYITITMAHNERVHYHSYIPEQP